MSARPGLLPVAVAIVAAGLVAALGATITQLGPWYYSLTQPSWAPPDMLFGPAWTLIFGLTAWAGLTAWRAAPGRAVAVTLLGLFALNGFLNLLWSFLFFRLHRPDWAAIEVLLLWASIAGLIVACRRVSRRAAWLLVPYLAWVTFAGILNAEIVRLNAPF